MSYVVLVVGAMGIASAIYIIADLSSPFAGVFVVSPAPLVDVLMSSSGRGGQPSLAQGFIVRSGSNFVARGAAVNDSYLRI